MPGGAPPGTSPLANLWSNLRSVWTEPVFENLLRGIVNDAGSEPRSSEIEDESVGAFITRRWAPEIANNLVSALYHGIYAGDIWKLSAKQLMAQPWRMETKYGDIASSLYDQVVNRRTWSFCDDVAMQVALQEVEWDDKIKNGMRDCSVFTLKHGLGQLTRALEQRLESKDNVSILRSTKVTDVTKKGSGVMVCWLFVFLFLVTTGWL